MTPADPIPSATGHHPWRSPADISTADPLLDVSMPVFNEARILEESLRRLHSHLTLFFPYTFRITVADNASTDSTLRIAERLARELPQLRVVGCKEPGRGNALRQVWLASPAPVLAYLEADLSTDLSALAPLLAPLISGHSDLSVGTRLARTSPATHRSQLPAFPRGYNTVLRTFFGATFTDAQCGVKAIRADVARILLPHITDGAWFFDTELLMVAERCGLRIHEVSLDWVPAPNPGVDVVRTALADLRRMARLSRNLRNGRIPVSGLRAELGRAGAPLIPSGFTRQTDERSGERSGERRKEVHG